jgi:hypothetical protein
VKWLTFKVQKDPGFRLNLTDICLLALLALVSIGVYKVVPTTGLHYIPLYVGFTFFLFCNVFRLRQRLEAVWFVPFTLYAAWALARMEIDWTLTLAVFVPLKAVLIIFHMYRGFYRGVFYERFGVVGKRR